MSSGSDVQANIAESLKLLDHAAGHEPDLVIFPEYQMLLPDYSDPERSRTKFEHDSGEFVSPFLRFTSENSTAILINFAELHGNGRYNTSALIVDGEISMKYRKTHLFDAYDYRESSVYDRGEKIPEPFKYRGFSIAPMICYDIRFAELARIYEERGADILVYQAGWYAGENKLDLWRALLRTRSTECGCYSIGVAQCGEKFTGHTTAFSPYGNSLGELGSETGIIDFVPDRHVLEKYRKDVPLREQRRNDLYRITF